MLITRGSGVTAVSNDDVKAILVLLNKLCCIPNVNSDLCIAEPSRQWWKVFLAHFNYSLHAIEIRYDLFQLHLECTMSCGYALLALSPGSPIVSMYAHAYVEMIGEPGDEANASWLCIIVHTSSISQTWISSTIKCLLISLGSPPPPLPMQSTCMKQC